MGAPGAAEDPLEAARARVLGDVLSLLDHELVREEAPDARAALIRIILLVEILLVQGRVRKTDPTLDPPVRTG